MSTLVWMWRHRLPKPLMATGPRTGRQITRSLPLIYRASKEWRAAVEFLGQEHSVGRRAAVALVWWDLWMALEVKQVVGSLEPRWWVVELGWCMWKLYGLAYGELQAFKSFRVYCYQFTHRTLCRTLTHGISSRSYEYMNELRLRRIATLFLDVRMLLLSSNFFFHYDELCKWVWTLHILWLRMTPHI